MRKILKVDELPKGFYYFTGTYQIEGTGKKLKEVKKLERVYSQKRK